MAGGEHELPRPGDLGQRAREHHDDQGPLAGGPEVLSNPGHAGPPVSSLSPPAVSRTER